MTERPLCRDVSLRAARECLTDAASYAAAALLELRDAEGFALIALAQGPTMRSVLRPMPPPSAEAVRRWAELVARVRAEQDKPICVCGDYPVAVDDPCAACAEHVS